MRLKDTVHYNLKNQLLILLIILVLFSGSAVLIDASFSEVIENADQVGVFLGNFLKPDFSYIPELFQPLIQTIAMSIAGTFIGVIVAVPVAFLATTVVTRNRYITAVFRFIMSVIRTIPSLLLAALIVAIFGIGEFSGLLSVAVFTFGMVGQLVYGSIETVDKLPIETQESVGANLMQIALVSIWLQINQNVISYALYAFEVNVRASTVLGYVGAGGIGQILSTQLNFFRYDRVAVIILIILLVVMVTDLISGVLRKELA